MDPTLVPIPVRLVSLHKLSTVPTSTSTSTLPPVMATTRAQSAYLDRRVCTPQANPPLLQLPAEVRQIIYIRVFQYSVYKYRLNHRKQPVGSSYPLSVLHHPDCPDILHKDCSVPSCRCIARLYAINRWHTPCKCLCQRGNPVVVLRVCRKIYAEAQPLFFPAIAVTIAQERIYTAGRRIPRLGP